MRENLSNCRPPSLDKITIRELRRILFVLIRYCWAPNSMPSSGRAMVSGALLQAKLSNVLTEPQYAKLKRMNFYWYDKRVKELRTEEERSLKELLNNNH